MITKSESTHLVTFTLCHTSLQLGEHEYSRYKDFAVNKLVVRDSNFLACPLSKCGEGIMVSDVASLTKDKGEGKLVIQCPK